MKHLYRLHDNNFSTVGTLIYNKNLTYSTLELPWRNNEKNISCIPPGEYKTIKQWHSNLGPVIKLLNVPGREDILIHRGNHTSDTIGCILVGTSFCKDRLKNTTKAITEIFHFWPKDGETLKIYGINS